MTTGSQLPHDRESAPESTAVGLVMGIATVLVSVLLVCAAPDMAAGWGATGHRLVSGIAATALPPELPVFLRTRDAIAVIGELGPEFDRSRDAGDVHDKERDPGHFVNLDDNAQVLGIVALGALPSTREDYDTRLRAHGATQYNAGYLPYAIIDGWQQLRKDFALWRVAVMGAETAIDPGDRALFETDRRLREGLIIRDIGVWSHYVADASQPLHVSIHFNGWGDYPNPKAYTTSKTLHADFEGVFVRRFATRERIVGALRAYEDCVCRIEERTKRYLRTTLSMVVPLYELEAQGGFKDGDVNGVEFMTHRLAAGAAELRDMIVDAWRASAEATVGYPHVNVRDLEANKGALKRILFGAD
jgi:hypothetical protein